MKGRIDLVRPAVTVAVVAGALVASGCASGSAPQPATAPLRSTVVQTVQQTVTQTVVQGPASTATSTTPVRTTTSTVRTPPTRSVPARTTTTTVAAPARTTSPASSRVTTTTGEAIGSVAVTTANRIVRSSTRTEQTTTRTEQTTTRTEQTTTQTEQTTTRRPSSTSVSTTGTATQSGVYYANCDAVRAAGKDPLHRGDAGYRPALDRDDDGVACEPFWTNTTSTTTAQKLISDVYFPNCSDAWDAGVAPLKRGEPGYRAGLDRDDDGIACEVRPTSTTSTSRTTTTSAPTSTTSAPTSTTTTAQKAISDVYYANCSAARAAGAAPLRKGQPGYRPALDRDGDGIACE